ncbi:hypothetical protein A7Q01_00915 [Eikenella sp. NML96-A-049]|uniref:hypothetical protein n=1 Tax=unclassified Eikenella TaxID=2639367 RepID=UPI0007E01161|nr:MULTISPECIES: hypothetical protein [unclassified Eikenella]OAM33547.1 hypothetical protein A7P97_08190 [Eikenella sp. NML070372]OAM36042.1 hypothetical protein A7P98_05640 [Eikenella sp. NML080894]OAM42479.1 hypothetical protein A7Q01_00915 [Eikenella sp. NML96-A-049]
MTLTEWFVNGETGLSSMTLALWLSEQKRPKKGVHFPYDPWDFRRCLLLLDAVPELRKKMHTLPELSKEWAAFYERWDDMEVSMRREMTGHTAPKTYALINEILKR